MQKVSTISVEVRDKADNISSSDIAAIIGYSESAHVVDSIIFSDAHLVQEGYRERTGSG